MLCPTSPANSPAARKQASRMADWLNPRLPPDIRILVSPTVRTVQTARHWDVITRYCWGWHPAPARTTCWLRQTGRWGPGQS